MMAWQVDEMWEAESARMWEDLNAPDPYENKMFEAAGSLAVAIGHLIPARDWVHEAAYELEETPMESKMESFAEEIDGILMMLKDLEEKYRRGVRE